MKTTLEKALSEYTTQELVDFHANLNAILLCVNEEFNVMPLLLRVHFALQKRNDKLSIAYLDAVSKTLAA